MILQIKNAVLSAVVFHLDQSVISRDETGFQVISLRGEKDGELCDKEPGWS